MLLGALQAFAPLSIDMYLPAMPVMETVFHTSAAAVQVTMVTFLLGYAVGQSCTGRSPTASAESRRFTPAFCCLSRLRRRVRSPHRSP